MKILIFILLSLSIKAHAQSPGNWGNTNGYPLPKTQVNWGDTKHGYPQAPCHWEVVYNPSTMQNQQVYICK